MTLPALLLCASLASFAGDATADQYYDRGMELARLERWDEARTSFERGRAADPSDRRFPIELAGIAFKRQRYSEAKRNLRLALSGEPADRYANDFLATLYQLDENTEAALKYWNRIDKPRIENVRIEPAPRRSAILLDRALAFSPASVLSREEFLVSAARLEFVEMFPRFRLELQALPEGDFDILLRAGERRNGRGALVSLFSGLPFQSVTPELFNVGSPGVNVSSILRWDKQKRRASVSLSGPLGQNANLRYRFFADGRNENWTIQGLHLRKGEFGGELRSRVGSRWGWSSGVAASHREFGNLDGAGPLFRDGALLKYRAAADAGLWRVPERRFTVGSGVSWEAGRMLRASPDQSFSKAQVSLDARWFPQARGDRYEMNARARAGKIFGQAPFDEQFMLGLERDNDLWMRGHVGTRDGRKGSAPLGSRFALLNWEADRVVHESGFIKVKLGPFVDTGSVGGQFGSKKWMWDVGAQSKVTVLGVGVVFSYGKDLRSGGHAYYATIMR